MRWTKWWRGLERSALRLSTRSINASGAFLLQRVPLALADRRAELKTLRKYWTAGNPKGNDVDMARLAFFAINIAALEAARVPGAFAELGVWRGHSAKVIHSLAPQRELYLLDTFDGFAADDLTSESVSGISNLFQDVSLAQVRDFLGDSKHIHFVVGYFPASASAIPPDERFAFVHIDCDLYQPVRAAMEFFYPRMSPKGLMVVHDFSSGRWPGVSQAVNEFLSDKPENPVLIPDTSGSAAIVCRGADAR